MRGAGQNALVVAEGAPGEDENDAFLPKDNPSSERTARVPWVDCIRVCLDFGMTLLLFIVIISDIEANAHPGHALLASNETHFHKTLHIHEMPIYLKTDISLGPMWTESLKAPEGTELADFKERVRGACQNRSIEFSTGPTLEEHPMCVCILAAVDEKETKNCMLKNPIPSESHNWTLTSFSSAAALWFLASLAMSVGTLPYVRTYMAWSFPADSTQAAGPGASASPQKTLVYKHHDVLVYIFIFIDLCMIAVPLIVTGIQFPQNQPHIMSVLQMLMWGLIGLVSVGAYNWTTLTGFITFHATETTGEGDRTNYADRKHMSSKNWIVYSHLLVSAPAIAVILHLTQQWMEYHTIINTTLIFSAIFAVDGFSHEMANYWLDQTYVSAKAMHEGPAGPQEMPHSSALAGLQDTHQADSAATPVTAQEVNVKGMHTSLGMIRLFSIAVNAVLLLLLYTLAYPLTVEEDKPASPIFVIVVIVYTGIFLLPDLAREFTHMVSFSAIEFRQYGDFFVRALTLLYVWRASVADQVA